MKQKSTSDKKMSDSKPGDLKDSAEVRIARHGFFLNDDLQGTNEGDQLATALAILIESKKEIFPDGG